MENNNTMNCLYRKYIAEEHINITKDTVDFIGVNYDIYKSHYSFKTYYFPLSCIEFPPKTNNPVIEYVQKYNMNRFYWKVRDSSNLREYISLFNRTDVNYYKLIAYISNCYPFIKSNLHEIETISEMKISNNIKNYNYSSLFLLGFKKTTNEHNNEVVGFEWLTRKCTDPDDIGYKYYYDDKYFFDYLKKIDIKEFLCIIDKLKLLRKKNLHFWVFAVDYSEKNKKYKIYIKGKGCKKMLIGSDILKILFPQTSEHIISELDIYCLSHTELYLYGFAICLDTNSRWSINYYFRPNN
jgi:hypothetical protein